jgi:hypothetical protein
MKEYPHRERLDNPPGDAVVVPAKYYRLKEHRRRVDKYDRMYADRIAAGQISPTPKRVTWETIFKPKI